MIRLIDADKLKDKLIELFAVEERLGYMDFAELRDVIDEQPTIDAIPREAVLDEINQAYNLIDAEYRIKAIECESSGTQSDVTDMNVGNKWISCSERLPNEGMRRPVLITESHYVPTRGYYYTNKYHSHEMCFCAEPYCGDKSFYYDVDKVEAWMPLPEPYPEEE
ncbi:MAG: DUF551 domain-containing protein [Eubacteriales bacterium]|nr:DUF551 domain-containing protein [Eubacteriales bacterium]